MDISLNINGFKEGGRSNKFRTTANGAAKRTLSRGGGNGGSSGRRPAAVRTARGQFEDERELNLSAYRKLIKLVKKEELLWKKRATSREDQETKRLYWRYIGNVVTKFSGIYVDAEKEFSKLRQKFGRELRKEKESVPRYGAWADQEIYISDWSLYKDLQFLKDVIKLRGTISNFPRKTGNQRICPLPSPPATKLEKGIFSARSSWICGPKTDFSSDNSSWMSPTSSVTPSKLRIEERLTLHQMKLLNEMASSSAPCFGPNNTPNNVVGSGIGVAGVTECVAVEVL